VPANAAMVIRFIDVLPSRVADVLPDTPAASFGLGARAPICHDRARRAWGRIILASQTVIPGRAPARARNPESGGRHKRWIPGSDLRSAQE
jgi:hypothetical protein